MSAVARKRKPLRGLTWHFFDWTYGRSGELVREADGGVLGRVIEHSTHGIAFFVYDRALPAKGGITEIRKVKSGLVYNMAEGMESVEDILGLGQGGMNEK